MDNNTCSVCPHYLEVILHVHYTFSCPWPMARNLNLFPPYPFISASFPSSPAGSAPGLRINTMGEKGVDCSNTCSRLTTGGVTNCSPMRPVTKLVMALNTLSTRKQRRTSSCWKSLRPSEYLPGIGEASGASRSNH